MAPGTAVLFAVALAGSGAPQERAPVLREAAFTLGAPAEAVAAVTVSCAGCDWGRAGREAGVLRVLVDGRYSRHLVLVRGERPAEYRVLLGEIGAGPHRVSVEVDPRLSARGIGHIDVSRVEVETRSAADPDHLLWAHAPVLVARPGSLRQFSDLPLLTWVEREATPRGTRLRYSVVFSNEDGGTPSDRLMATWGRLTDIEFVYGVELDTGGRPLAAAYQAAGHAIVPFEGVREGRHPVLYVVTDNNMLSDDGAPGERVAPAPLLFDLTGTSREALMDAHPWTYVVSSAEARREGRVAAQAKPGDGHVPDPQRFVHLEACAETRDAALTFGVGVAGAAGEVQWFDSDGAQPGFRIARSPDHFPNGCFRGAVALPAGTPSERVRALRFRAFTRAPRGDEPPLPPGAGSARVRRVNKLFLLGPDGQPGPSLFEWTGDLPLAPEGPPAELPLGAMPAIGG